VKVNFNITTIYKKDNHSTIVFKNGGKRNILNMGNMIFFLLSLI